MNTQTLADQTATTIGAKLIHTMDGVMTLAQALAARPDAAYMKAIKISMDCSESCGDASRGPRPQLMPRELALAQRHPASPTARGFAQLARRELKRPKYATPEQWAAWPFCPVRADKQTTPSSTQSATPRNMEPLEALPQPYELSVHTHSLEVGWEAYAGEVSGYELQGSEQCPLDGPQPCTVLYRGGALSFTLGGLLPQTRMSFRVRAYNGAVSGPWSAPCVFSSLVEPPRPPPMPATTLPDSWRSLDVADLLKSEEKRTGLPAAVVEAALLECLRDHLTALKITFRFYSLSGASGSSGGSRNAAPATMGMNQFISFAKVGCGLAASELHKGQLIFTRATRAVRAGGDMAEVVALAAANANSGNSSTDQQPSSVASMPSTAAASGAASKGGGEQFKASGAWQGAVAATKAAGRLGGKSSKGSCGMEQCQFVCGVVRLAALLHQNRMQSGQLCLVDALGAMLSTRVVPHVATDLDLAQDAFKSVYGGRLMRVVRRKHHERLRAVFRFFSSLEKSVGKASTGHEATTMDIGEASELCEELALIDEHFGVREFVACFVRVNIDDEIFEFGEAGNTPSELVFDEF